MSPKAYILKLLLTIIGLSILVSGSLSSTTRRSEEVDDPFELMSEAIVNKSMLTEKMQQIRKEPLEYKKINRILKPDLLKQHEISLKDLISLFIDIFYTNLSYRTKWLLNVDKAVVDENIRADYRRLIDLIEEEVMNYIVPVNFIEIFSSRENLFNITVSKIYAINYIPKMREINRMRINEEFHSIMTIPKLYSRNLGYSMDNLISFIEKIILNPVINDKENDRLRISYQELIDKFALRVKEDRKGSFRNKSWASLIKTILSEVPQNLRNEVFSGNWKRNMDGKVLDLIKNLSIMYHFNHFSLNNLNNYDDQFFEEFSRCIRCQRIVLESILISMEEFLRHCFERYNGHDEL